MQEDDQPLSIVVFLETQQKDITTLRGLVSTLADRLSHVLPPEIPGPVVCAAENASLHPPYCPVIDGIISQTEELQGIISTTNRLINTLQM